MLFSIFNNFLLGNQFVGMELFSSKEEEGIALLHVERKKKELQLVHKEKRKNFQDVLINLNKKTPVFLTINNSQIIHKEVEGIESVDSKLLHKAFPHINKDDFYYEIWRFHSKSIIAICRKDYLEQILNQFTKHKIIVAGISLGVCAISQISAFLKESEIVLNHHKISLIETETMIASVENSTINYNINGLEIQNNYLIGFASILQHILGHNKNSGNLTSKNKFLIDSFYQGAFFDKILKLSVFVLFILLLINFFIFNNYYKKSEELASSVSVSKILIEKIKTTKSRLKNKEKKINEILSSSQSKSSLRINEIIKDLPYTVLLDELVYCPLEKNIKQEEPIKFQTEAILISGKTTNANDLTNWIERLSKLKWIKSTTIVHFGKNENEDSVFTLKLKLNEAK